MDIQTNLRAILRLQLVTNIVVIAFGFSGLDSVVHADEVRPLVYGKKYTEWTARWWQWAYAGPDGQNAVQDTTGEFCDVHQPKGPVWFLAGTFGEIGVERSCTIPHGRALFYPLNNIVWVDCPNTEDHKVPDREVRAILAGIQDISCQLTSELDGVAISSRRIPTVRTQSPEFHTVLPKNNVVNGCPAPVPAGKTGRMIADGYWIMLPPLSPGKHTLKLHGASCDPETGDVTFETSVTYHLTAE